MCRSKKNLKILCTEHLDATALPPMLPMETSFPGAKLSNLGSVLDIARSSGIGSIDLLEGSENAEVKAIQIIESLDQMSRVQSGSLAVIDRRLSQIATTYQLDIAIRIAASKDAVGLAVFASNSERLSKTARVIARKTQIALIRLDPIVDLDVVVRTMAQQAADQIHLTIDKVRKAADAISRVGVRYNTIEEVVAVSCVLLGREIRIAENKKFVANDCLSVPIRSATQSSSWLFTARIADDDANALMELFLWRLAAEINDITTAQEQVLHESRQNDAELLLQLLLSNQEGLNSASEIARRLKIPVDSSHTVVRVELDHYLLSETNNSFQMREQLSKSLQYASSKESGKWRITHCPSLILLLLTHDETEISVKSISQSVARVLGEMVRSTPEIQVFCGIGSTNTKLTGIISSANEALFAASTARTRKCHNHVISFDVTGIKKSLVEWYSFDSVKHSIATLLSPLNELSAAKRDSILVTIATYLDFQGSLNKTASALHLHRNAVSYRIKHAFDLLDVDPSDPDQMLFLHLASRAEVTLSKTFNSSI